MPRIAHCCLLLIAVVLLSPGGARGAEKQKIAPPIRDPRHFTAENVWSWKALRENNVVMQKHDFSCGAACLATLIRYYWGDPATEDQFLVAIGGMLTPEEIKDRMKNGLSMTDLRKAAVATGYQATLGERNMSQLLEMQVPAILRIKVREHEHFVVYRGALNDRVFLADPIRGNVRVAVADFCQQWTDGVILVVAKPDVDLPKCPPLMVRSHCPVQPELEAARRQIDLPPETQQRTLRAPSVVIFN